MEDGDAQDLPRTPIELYTTDGCISSEGVYTQMIGEFHSQHPKILSWNYLPPLYNQLARYSVSPDHHWEQCYWPFVTGPTVLSPWHNSGASAQVALTPSVSDEINENPGDDFGGELRFADDRIWANGPRPGRRIIGQEDSFGGTNSPFNQGNGNDAQLCNPRTTSDSQLPPLSPQQPEYVPVPESSGLQRFPETETAQGSKEWPCDRDGCNKSYKRPQEVRRHVREKHGVLPKCLICGIEWTRAEKIRRHLIKRHRGQFTKKERRQIRHLEGLNNTIEFLKKWEITRL